MFRAVLLLFACGMASCSAAPPNVLFIAIDDLNDWVGCLKGHPQADTPNIDGLADRGTLFRNAHCQGPICGPSRVSLLSGKYPFTTGVYQQPRKQGIPEDREHFAGHMLPEYFAAQGYKTLAVGKICHGYSQTVERFRQLLPAQNAPYHVSTKSGPINSWFQEHLKQNGVVPRAR